MPVTGSLVSPTLFSRRDADFAYRYSTDCIDCDTDWILPAIYQVLLLKHAAGRTMDADGFSIMDNRAGVTFGIELYVPWDVPDMAIDLTSGGMVPLRNVPDVFGMSGRRGSATESHILQGRDTRSVRVLVPDCRGLEQNFHDVFGMSGRRDSATESRILQGRDARSVRILVPDCHGLEQNFHDVTVVDMGDLSESEVSIPELSVLAHRWPPAVITYMSWSS